MLNGRCHESPLGSTAIVTGTVGAAIRGRIESPAMAGERALASHHRAPQVQFYLPLTPSSRRLVNR